MFALVDCNNFYASCERVFRPELRGKPIVVLSNNDGCVIARSNEAKACGIPMGAPAYQFEKTFIENKIHVFSSNFALYGDMSSRVMSLLSSFAPEMEIYSIDEAFLKFEGCKYLNLQEYGLMIVKTVTKSTGVPVSIGIAKTKALSKVATKVAKKFPERTGGVYLIDDDEKRIKAKKNIATTRSFEKQYTEIEELRERISTFSVTCAEKLRSQGSCCNVLLVFLHTNWFRKDLPQYSRNIVMQLPYPTNSSIEIARFAKEGLALIFKKGYQYKKAGVIVMDITPAAANQISFFENSNPKHKVLMEVIDRLNASIGQKKVKLASQALDRTWKMKQERLSPRYSTRFSEIITIYT